TEAVVADCRVPRRVEIARERVRRDLVVRDLARREQPGLNQRGKGLLGDELVDQRGSEVRIGRVGRDGVGDADSADVQHVATLLERWRQEEPGRIGPEVLAYGSSLPTALHQHRPRAGFEQGCGVVSADALEALEEVPVAHPLLEPGSGIDDRLILERLLARSVDDAVEIFTGGHGPVDVAEEVNGRPPVEIAEHQRRLSGVEQLLEDRLEVVERGRYLDTDLLEDGPVVVQTNDLCLGRHAPELTGAELGAIRAVHVAREETLREAFSPAVLLDVAADVN